MAAPAPAHAPTSPAPSLPQRVPWLYLGCGAISLVIHLHPGWRDALLQDRAALIAGEWWRAWTGHFVHFGWPHYIADIGLFLILGWMLAGRHPWFGRISLVLLPPFVSLAIHLFDPSLSRYGGLSAVNLGLLVYLALQGWRRNWTDWFWPAILTIYIAEVVFEIFQGGRGGGLIRFDDPTIRVATSAHIAAAVYAFGAFLLVRKEARPEPVPAKADLP